MYEYKDSLMATLLKYIIFMFFDNRSFPQYPPYNVSYFLIFCRWKQIIDLLETKGTAKMAVVMYLSLFIVFNSTIVMPEKHIDIIFFRNNNRFCNLLKLQQVWYQFILMRFDISRFEIKIVFQITNCEMKISRYCSVTTRSYYVIGKKIDWGHGKILLVFLFYFYYSSMSYATVRFCFTSFINIITIQRYNLILLLRN